MAERIYRTPKDAAELNRCRQWAEHGPALLEAAVNARAKIKEVCEDCYGEYHDSDGLSAAIAKCQEIK